MSHPEPIPGRASDAGPEYREPAPKDWYDCVQEAEESTRDALRAEGVAKRRELINAAREWLRQAEELL